MACSNRWLAAVAMGGILSGCATYDDHGYSEPYYGYGYSQPYYGYGYGPYYSDYGTTADRPQWDSISGFGIGPTANGVMLRTTISIASMSDRNGRRSARRRIRPTVRA